MTAVQTETHYTMLFCCITYQGAAHFEHGSNFTAQSIE